MSHELSTYKGSNSRTMTHYIRMYRSHKLFAGGGSKSRSEYISHELCPIMYIYTWVTNCDSLNVYVHESRIMMHYMYTYMSHELWLIVCIHIWVTNYDSLYVYVYESRFLIIRVANSLSMGGARVTPCNTLQHSATRYDIEQHRTTRCNTRNTL